MGELLRDQVLPRAIINHQGSSILLNNMTSILLVKTTTGMMTMGMGMQRIMTEDIKTNMLVAGEMVIRRPTETIRHSKNITEMIEVADIPREVVGAVVRCRDFL